MCDYYINKPLAMKCHSANDFVAKCCRAEPQVGPNYAPLQLSILADPISSILQNFFISYLNLFAHLQQLPKAAAVSKPLNSTIFSSQPNNSPSMLECLSLAKLSSLV
jgi:hypothetical protein